MSARDASPEPTPGLRESVQWAISTLDDIVETTLDDIVETTLDDIVEMVEIGGDIPTEITIVQNRLRAALDASPAPEPRVAPCDDEQLEAAFMKGVESAAEARAVQAEYAAPEPTGLDAERLARALIPVTRRLHIAGGDKGLDKWRHETAEKIAAEYARLSSKEAEG